MVLLAMMAKLLRGRVTSNSDGLACNDGKVVLVSCQDLVNLQIVGAILLFKLSLMWKVMVLTFNVLTKICSFESVGAVVENCGVDGASSRHQHLWL